MATSGTVGRTVIDTAAIIEHAFRRCRVAPSAQTPETILIAKENLYLLMLNIGNRGLNLWAVEDIHVGLVEGKATYTMPLGTLDVLNVIYSQPTIVSGTFTSEVSGGYVTITEVNRLISVGVKLTSDYTGTVLVEGSVDGFSYHTLETLNNISYSPSAYNWIDLPTVEWLLAIRVSFPTSVVTVSDMLVSSKQYDLPCRPWNRDTYMAINAKAQLGRPSTNYFFEKKLTPTITLWPTPNNSTDFLSLFVHRQSQDVGTLTEQIEIPQRWLDGIIWMLAARLCFELPGIDASLIPVITAMADKQELEAEQAETDGAPIYLQPNIGCYSV